MASKIIEVPGLGNVEFPEDMPDAEISAAIQNTLSQKNQGPLGLVSPESRAERQEALNKRSGFERFAVSAAPPVVGSIVGGALGAPLGPLGIAAGAALGGGLAELGGQEFGTSPRSNLALGMSAAAPFLGPAAGVASKLGGQATRAGLRQMQMVRAAVGRRASEDLIPQAQAIGRRILAKQQGLMAVEPSRLYTAARSAGVRVSPENLPNTQQALSLLEREARQFASFPEGQQVLGMIDDIRGTLNLVPPRPTIGQRLAEAGVMPRAPVAPTPTLSADFEAFIRARQQIGAAIGRLENVGGAKLGAAKKAFSGIAADMDNLAKLPGARGAAARLTQAATQRAKLDFAVDDLQGIVARATKQVGGEGEEVVTLNAKAVLDKIGALTNPKHPQFDQNFATALKDHLPGIRQLMGKLNQLETSMGGPGSLVLRGAMARGMRQTIMPLFGLGAGASMGGPLGAMIGTSAGVFGARSPEMITAGLLSPWGRRFLDFAMREGRGQISPARWATFAQVVNQMGISGGREGERKAREFFGAPPPPAMAGQ